MCTSKWRKQLIRSHQSICVNFFFFFVLFFHVPCLSVGFVFFICKIKMLNSRVACDYVVVHWLTHIISSAAAGAWKSRMKIVKRAEPWIIHTAVPVNEYYYHRKYNYKCDLDIRMSTQKQTQWSIRFAVEIDTQHRWAHHNIRKKK